MDGFNRGLMTGAQLGGRMFENKQNREIGGLMASGNYEGAASAAYGGGNIQAGQGLERLGQQRQAQERQGQITGALQGGNFDDAMSFASSPEEMQAIAEYRATASEAEIAQKAQQAQMMASVIESVLTLPPEQQLAAAQQFAPQFGVDPAQITQQSIQALPGIRVQALGLKDYLMQQGRETDDRRQQEVAESQIAANQALINQRGISAQVTQSREARQSRPRASGGGGGGAAPAAAPRSTGGGSLPPGFTIRRR